MQVIILVIAGSALALYFVQAAGPRGDHGRDLLRWAWAMLPMGPVAALSAFAIGDVVTRDGQRSFGRIGDIALTTTLLALAATPPVVGYVLSIRAALASFRIAALAPAALVVVTAAAVTVLVGTREPTAWWVLPAALTLAGAGGVFAAAARARHRPRRPEEDPTRLTA